MSLHAVTSAFQNVSECMQERSRMFQNACRTFKNVPECMQNVPECYTGCPKINALLSLKAYNSGLEEAIGARRDSLGILGL